MNSVYQGQAVVIYFIVMIAGFLKTDHDLHFRTR
jgi:hypothetical protein